MTWRTARQYSRRRFAAAESTPPRPEGRPTLTAKPTAPRPSFTAKPAATPTIPARVTGPQLLLPSQRPRPSDGYHPRSPDLVYHPPGPGIGLRPGPAPALGRPGLLPGDHGAWKNRSLYAQGSKGWKPDIMSLGDAHNCPGEKGPQSPSRPPNISGGRGGYNSTTFRDEASVAHALQYLGYRGQDGNAMLRKFQRNWNLVTSRIASVPNRYSNINFVHIPQGLLQVDGKIGPNTLNALEIAVVNQRTSSQLAWTKMIEMVITAGSGYGKKRLYNAAQGM